MLSVSNLARVSGTRRSSPPAKDSISISAVTVEDSCRFARSTVAYRRRIARSPTSTFGCALAKVCSTHAAVLESMSSPPRRVFPPVARTSKMPPSIASTDTSNVPPPRSNTSTLLSLPECSASKPYASAAAVGSLITRSTDMPAIAPASLVAARCASLKWAGTVITQRQTGLPRKASASALSCCSTIADTCSGAKERTSPPQAAAETVMSGLSCAPATTLHERCLRSACTSLSEKCLPMSRFASLIVFLGLAAA
mmetsp:Transcript_17400/g.39763  ORF Transcript_17400/g.39763 Transcript_17400/m.39763 type:complete len:254 (-) Transcript_17400:860-1621(-)